MKIAAIIVTYNRKQLASALIKDFLEQTRRPDGILVIDNGSEDGTAEFVRENFSSVKLIELDNNIGHMGGLETGIKTAFQQGYDAVFSVDDDARLRKDTVECLLNAIETHEELRDAVIWSANVTPDGQFFSEPTSVKAADDWKIYDRFLPELYNKVYETFGSANVGLYIPRSIVECVGLPRADLIFVGEFEFNLRVRTAGFKLFRCFTSIIYHERNKFAEIKFLGRTRFVSKSQPFRTYYEIRNRIFVDLTYKRRSVLRSLLNTAVDSILKIYVCERKILTLAYIFKGLYDGLFGRMGMRVPIKRAPGADQRK